jgi:Domain of unknown function (DUF4112)
MAQTFAEPRPMRPLPSPAVARNLERIAWLMDRTIKIPGTQVTLGLDALLGLLPVGGDVLTGFVQAGLVLVALKHYRVPRAVAARMMGNVVLDITVGAIPLLGDLFDVVFKANTANLKLLEPYQRNRDTPGVILAPIQDGGRSLRKTDRHAVDARPGGTPWRYLLPIAAVLVTTLALVIIGLVTIVRWLL